MLITSCININININIKHINYFRRKKQRLSMTGTLCIDGRDAYTDYGAYITSTGYRDLLCFPSVKAVPAIDWPEEDGIEADLSAMRLDTKELSITFGAHGNKTEAFFELLADKAYHIFDFREIGRAYRLRLVSESSLAVKRDLRTFTLRFADDFPLPEGYVYMSPQSSVPVVQSGYALGKRNLADYGVCILKGSLAEILKTPAVKRNLLRNIATQHGAIYDGELVKFQSKDVKLHCLMQAKTLTEFWRNRDALLFDLTHPGERTLRAGGMKYPCYYKSSSVAQFFPDGKVWFKFDLTLTFTSAGSRITNALFHDGYLHPDNYLYHDSYLITA
jgi:hypothetical protein